MKDKKLKIALCCDAFFPMVDGVINAVHNYASKLSENMMSQFLFLKVQTKTLLTTFHTRLCVAKIFL